MSQRSQRFRQSADHIGQTVNERYARAFVLAYIEGATDDRTAGSAVDEIIRRYEAIVGTEGWEPSLPGDEGPR